MFATIHDPTGLHLGDADAAIGDAGIVTLTLHQHSRPPLLTYYFHRGGRAVFVEIDDVAFRGSLRTCMDGTHRLWWVQLNHARGHKEAARAA